MAQSKIRMTVDWYNVPDLKSSGRNLEYRSNPFLYLCLGKVKYQRRNMLQSFGCSNSLSDVLFEKEVRLVSRERQIWLGFVTTLEPSGQTHLAGLTHVCYANFIYHKVLKFRNKRFLEGHDTCENAEIFNRWWRRETVFARKVSPHVDWPDMIIYREGGSLAPNLKLGEPQDLAINSTHIQEVETLAPHLQHWK